MCFWIDILQWKKMKKIRIIFEIENWLLKSNFGTFDTFPLTQFSKFNIVFNSNFVPSTWKLHNPYCHGMSFWKLKFQYVYFLWFKHRIWLFFFYQHSCQLCISTVSFSQLLFWKELESRKNSVVIYIFLKKNSDIIFFDEKYKLLPSGKI